MRRKGRLYRIIDRYFSTKIETRTGDHAQRLIAGDIKLFEKMWKWSYWRYLVTMISAESRRNLSCAGSGPADRIANTHEVNPTAIRYGRYDIMNYSKDPPNRVMWSIQVVDKDDNERWKPHRICPGPDRSRKYETELQERELKISKAGIALAQEVL